MPYSSEALKRGIKPPKDPKKMTQAEREEWLKTLDPDMMGFDGHEGMDVGEAICP